MSSTFREFERIIQKKAIPSVTEERTISLEMFNKTVNCAEFIAFFLIFKLQSI